MYTYNIRVCIHKACIRYSYPRLMCWQAWGHGSVSRGNTQVLRNWEWGKNTHTYARIGLLSGRQTMPIYIYMWLHIIYITMYIYKPECAENLNSAETLIIKDYVFVFTTHVTDRIYVCFKWCFMDALLRCLTNNIQFKKSHY